jgi:hypothetical protein
MSSSSSSLSSLSAAAFVLAARDRDSFLTACGWTIVVVVVVVAIEVGILFTRVRPDYLRRCRRPQKCLQDLLGRGCSDACEVVANDFVVIVTRVTMVPSVVEAAEAEADYRSD